MFEWRFWGLLQTAAHADELHVFSEPAIDLSTSVPLLILPLEIRNDHMIETDAKQKLRGAAENCAAVRSSDLANF